MIIPDSLPVEVNLDVCDTMPMFVEDIELPSAPKDAVVFTTGSESSDPPTATTDVTGDHVDGSKETDSVDPPQPPVKKPRGPSTCTNVSAVQARWVGCAIVEIKSILFVQLSN